MFSKSSRSSSAKRLNSMERDGSQKFMFWWWYWQFSSSCSEGQKSLISEMVESSSTWVVIFWKKSCTDDWRGLGGWFRILWILVFFSSDMLTIFFIGNDYLTSISYFAMTELYFSTFFSSDDSNFFLILLLRCLFLEFLLENVLDSDSSIHILPTPISRVSFFSTCMVCTGVSFLF